MKDDAGTATDRIEKQVTLEAPLERVWAAVGDSARFGEWFGVRIDGAFAAGKRLACAVVPTMADPEVAAMQAPYEGTRFEIVVVAVEAPRRLAFRWHPHGVDPAVDPMTLVEFTLEAVDAGRTRLTIVESGFDAIPAERRAKAFRANEGGWTMQGRLVASYLAMGRA